jgi:hypothetical protein
MQFWRHTLIRLYMRLLRLYPPHFRAEYADEMVEVFALAVGEAKNGLSVLSILGAELRDLPLSVLRERLPEGYLAEHSIMREGSMTWLYSARLRRICTIAILALAGFYIVSVISAYLAFDLHFHSWQTAQEWWYAYDENSAFITRHLPIGLLVLIVYLLTPPGMVVFGSALGLNVVGGWRYLSVADRRLALLALVAAALLLRSLNKPLTYIGSLWFYD